MRPWTSQLAWNYIWGGAWHMFDPRN